MKQLKFDHTQTDIIKSMGVSDRRAKTIDTYVRNSFNQGGIKLSEIITGGIDTGIVTNREQLAFLSFCIGIMFEKTYQHMLAHEEPVTDN